MTSSDRFGLADLISLVAAFAVAFAVCLFMFRQWNRLEPEWDVVNTLSVGWSFAQYTLLVMTFYCGAMILRRRPSRSAIVQSRGQACALAICVAALTAIPTHWNAIFHTALPYYVLLVTMPLSLASDPLVGASVAICTWLTLKLADVPTAKPTWLDRLGKSLSVVWLLFACVQPILDFEVLRALGVQW